jgi:hypothetical protein
MDVDESELIGEPLEEAPEQSSDYDCNARKSDGGVFQGYCGARAGKGTDHVGEGRCSNHGGDSSGAPEGNDNAVGNDGGAAPEGNDNAARHEMYAERNAYYQRCDEREQALIDAIYADYREEYERRHGREPLTGDDLKLFGIAIGLHKTELRADDWPEDRPSSLDSGHELVDRSEKKSPQGETYYEYTPAAVLRGEKTVSQDVRMWLKDLGLLEPPDDDTTVNVNVHEELLDGMKAAHED